MVEKRGQQFPTIMVEEEDREGGQQGAATDKKTDVWFRAFLKWKINFGLWAVFSLFRDQKYF